MKKCTTSTFHILPPPADLAEGLQTSSLTTTRHRGPVRSYYIANSTLASSASTTHGDIPYRVAEDVPIRNGSATSSLSGCFGSHAGAR